MRFLEGHACVSLALAVGLAGCTKATASTPPDAGDTDAGDTDAGGPSVGVTTRTWIDTSRPTPQNGTAPALPSRTLVTDVWYPTSAPPSGQPSIQDAPKWDGLPV
jgi:hypothetical protein